MRVNAQSCSFCQIVADDDPELLVYRSEHVVGFLDIRPVFHGHCLLVPRVHYETLDQMPLELAQPLLHATQVTMRALAEAVGAQGTFIANNNVVSQSVPHLHVHVVPRRRKDGLRGFFWPRHPYEDATALDDMRKRVRTAIEAATDA